MKRNHEFVITGFATSMLMIVFFFNTLTHLDQPLSIGEDALKNYYTMDYQIQHGQHLLWFEGMNYPYGEHLVFTDAQPLISWLLSFINLITEVNTILSVNLLLMISLFLTPFVVLLLFKEIGVSGWETAIFSSLVVMMSPQVYRLNGHYALAYTIILPLFLLFLIRYITANNNRQLIQLFLLTILSGLIHPYYVFIFLIFGTCLSVASIFKKVYRKKAFFILIVLSASTLLLYGLIMAADPVTDRPSSPFGIIKYTANLHETFLPTGIKFHPLNFINHSSRGFESKNYLGLGTILGVILGMSMIKNSKNSILLVLLVTSLLVFVIALAVPFYILYVIDPYLIDHLGPIRQFRSLGRLGWVFYYTMSICGFSLLYSWLKGRKLWIRVSLMILLVLETALVNSNATTQLSAPFKVLDTAPQFLLDSYETYDTIITLPFFHIGSENFAFNTSHAAFNTSLGLSSTTGIPLVGSFLSRTSVNQSYEKLQFALGETKEVFQDKKYLLVVDSNSVRKVEQHFLTNSKKLGIWNNMDLYSYSPKTQTPENFKAEKWRSVANGKKIILFDSLSNKGKYKISIWVNNMNVDNIPNTRFNIEIKNDEGKTHTIKSERIGDLISKTSRTAAKIECAYYLEENIRMMVSLTNNKYSDSVYVSNFKISPISSN